MSAVATKSRKTKAVAAKISFTRLSDLHAYISESPCDIISIKEHFKTGETKHIYKEHPLLSHRQSDQYKPFHGYVDGDGNCFSIFYYDETSCTIRHLPNPSYPKSFSAKLYVVSFKGSYLFLRNGDEDNVDYDNVVSQMDGIPVSTVSVRCLERMFGKGALENLVTGSIEIVDYLPDDFVPHGPRSAPKKHGYTYIEDVGWHCAGTICFRYKGAFYVMGSDEGSYFCSQLPKIKANSLTMQQAFDALIPDEAKKHRHRQGEWFLVDVNAKDVPALENCIASISDDQQACIGLPVDHAKSNIHVITSNEIRIAKDGIIYAKEGDVYHSQHDTVEFDGWTKFVRNTAVKSVSVQGVD